MPAPLTGSTPRGRPAAERGYALLIAVFSVLMLAGIIASSSESSRAGQGITEYDIVAPARAREVALAGVAESLSWFRRQTVQPVTAFAPRLDLEANPPVNETADPDLGLTREYEITPGIWARYEVRLGSPAEAFTDTNGNGIYEDGIDEFLDTNENGRRDRAHGTRDVSSARGQVGAGSVWMIESRGSLYRRPRAAQPLGEGPNTRFATYAAATELRRMTITPPAAAAICAQNGYRVTIGSRGRVRGSSGAGIGYREGTASPVLQSGSQVTGAPSTASIPGFDFSLGKVFGNNLTALRGMADVAVTDHTILPADLGEYTLTVIEGDAVFDSARPLRGTGVVIVTGDCTLSSGSASFFNGVLWVGDDLVIEGPCYLRGVCIAGDRIEVRGTGGDHAELEYDGAIVDELMTRMGSYRPSKATYKLDGDPAPSLSEGTP
ncbi:MAG: hypothetical protein O2894_00645 [Planctomycetota bacterium]|nr:hypothetical protein [Planctomycetota bacterium]